MSLEKLKRLNEEAHEIAKIIAEDDPELAAFLSTLYIANETHMFHLEKKIENLINGKDNFKKRW